MAKFAKLCETNTTITELRGMTHLPMTLTKFIERNRARERQSEQVEEKTDMQASARTCLSIDNSLMHSFIPAILLDAIEKKYKIETHKFFDCIGGTGFGSIIAFGLGVLKDNNRIMDPTTLIDLFSKSGKKIFETKTKNNRYDVSNLKKLIHEFFNGLYLSDTATQIIVPCGKINPALPFIFDSYEAQKTLAYDYKIEDIIQASCADEFYFPALTFENNQREKVTYRSPKPPYNPAHHVYEELKSKNDRGPIKLLSLGVNVHELDYENELQINAIDGYLKKELGSSYRRLAPSSDPSCDGLSQPNQEIVKLYRQKAETIIEDNNFIRLLIESKR